ncbi:MAG TPA: hypothetical protein VF698_15095, partial [Thermoanaerobaculia bacterium]
YGAKWTSGHVSAQEAVRVYVRAKQTRRSVRSADLVPEEVDGVPTDVVEVGEGTPAFPRPTRCGVSGGHRAVAIGTLGCLVSSNGGGRFILSNNHVLADGNDGPIGVEILEPALDDGGAANNPIAHLTDFEPLRYGGAINEIDAAIAELADPNFMSADIEIIGAVAAPPIPPVEQTSVAKHGRTTLHQLGTIVDIHADRGFLYPGHGKAYFHDQIVVTGTHRAFADRGDSGSLVVDEATRRPVGLLFAISGSAVYCNYIEKVLTRFHAALL